MLLHKESLNELRQHFRLNIYEIKIWTSLLSRGIAAASELAEISSVPRSRCYDVLESLEKKGFIMMKIGKPIKYIAVEPEAIMERVEKQLKEEAEQKIQIMEELKETDIFKELELLHKTGIKKIDVDSITDSVVGRNNVNRFIKEMILRAGKSVTIVTNKEGIRQKLKILKKLNENLIKRKIKVRVYTNDEESINASLKGIEISKINYNGRFVNVDNEEIFFVMGQDKEYSSGIWVKSQFFVSNLNALIENSGIFAIETFK
ncbi:TrmB family transcriptional regulator [Candidatus Woesearchaeota archaeon]|nr:TrmB family transcriptional regulator [Candidatus Woesearchaeota archaeon]